MICKVNSDAASSVSYQFACIYLVFRSHVHTSCEFYFFKQVLKTLKNALGRTAVEVFVLDFEKGNRILSF